jgi:hypothetical protein
MATRWQSIPGATEDVVQRTSEDIGKVRKRMNVDSSGLKGGAKDSVREAGGRAARRLGARAGLAGAALSGGYEAGRAIDEATGVGRKMVDKAGSAIDRASTGDRVKLTKEAKQQLEDEENFQGMVDAMHAVRDEDIAAGKKRYASGGKVRGGGCESRGKTKGRFV